MKAIVRRLIKEEGGQALLLAVILLLVAGLVVASLLSFMGTGLRLNPVYEGRVAELYAADAGVEDAMWKIQRGNVTACAADPTQPPYTISVNDRNVTVYIEYDLSVSMYKITSVAATIDGGNTAAIDSATRVQAYAAADTEYVDYSGILDNVITSPCDYTLGGPTQVDPPEEEDHGPEANYDGDWPTAEILSAIYLEDVEEYPYAFSTLDVKDYTGGIGPLYRTGTLDIENTGTADLTVQLSGTVYVTDDTLIGMTGKAFTLDLNGHTIFVESDSGAAPEDDPCNPTNEYALKIGTKCTLTGSGCIIAVGSIEFKPNLAFTEGDFVFVLSISGKTYMQPSGDFYGSLAGSAEVYIQNAEAHWFVSPFIEGGLNFPYMAVVNQLYSIASWEVTPLSRNDFGD